MLLALVVACAVGDVDSDKLIAVARAYREQQISRFEKGLAESKKAKSGEGVKAASSQLKKLKNSPLVVPPLFPPTIKLGDIGFLVGGYSGPKDSLENYFRVWHIVDKSNFIIRKDQDRTHLRPHDEFFVWISGIPTDGLIDEKIVQLPQIFVAESTAKFGGMTMFKVVPFPIQDAGPVLKKATKP